MARTITEYLHALTDEQLEEMLDGIIAVFASRYPVGGEQE